nr:hypothetical protein [Tanacetum cinerariifolium]
MTANEQPSVEATHKDETDLADMVSDDVRGDPKQRHKTFLLSFIDRAFLLQRYLDSATKEAMEEFRRFEEEMQQQSNKKLQQQLKVWRKLQAKSLFYHEPSIAIIVSAGVVDRSIGIDNPHLEFLVSSRL